MPNIKSAKDRVELSAKQNLRNRINRSALKTTIRRFDEAVAANDATLTGEALKAAVVKIDKAVAKGLIHKNTAARKKSRMYASAAHQSN